MSEQIPPPYPCYRNRTSPEPTRENYITRTPTQPIDSHIATPDELGVSATCLTDILREIQLTYTGTSRAILAYMGSTPLPGLEIPADIIQDSVFTRLPHSIDAFRTAVSLNTAPSGTDHTSEPYAQRGVTLPFGSVYPDGQICLALNVTGVGLTESRSRKFWEWTHENTHGIKTSIAPQLEIHRYTRDSGILTSRPLPPVVCDTRYINGVLIPATLIVPRGNHAFIQTETYATNRRVCALFRGSMPAAFNIEKDIPLILGDISTEVSVARSRIVEFLTDASLLKNYNDTYNTNYFLGCSKYMPHNSDYTDYVHAFRTQSILNLAGMLSNWCLHNNLSVQNVSLAAEIGDWDDTLSIRNGKMYVRGIQRQMDTNRMIADGIDVCRRMYRIVNLVGALITGSTIPWRMFEEQYRRLLPSGHTFDIPMEQLHGRIWGSRSEFVQAITTEENLFTELANAVSGFLTTVKQPDKVLTFSPDTGYTVHTDE